MIHFLIRYYNKSVTVYTVSAHNICRSCQRCTPSARARGVIREIGLVLCHPTLSAQVSVQHNPPLQLSCMFTLRCSSSLPPPLRNTKALNNSQMDNILPTLKSANFTQIPSVQMKQNSFNILKYFSSSIFRKL